MFHGTEGQRVRVNVGLILGVHQRNVRLLATSALFSGSSASAYILNTYP
jgi:hypothetical protein